ncbi:MAG: MFS transporter [Alphaproteobacteria bacterium]|jgi:MFS family permease
MNKVSIKITGYAWFIWGVASFFYLFQYILRVSPSVMMPGIMQQFSITAVDFGYFSAAYYLGYTLMHLPFGIMLDRYKISTIIAVAFAISVIGLVPLIYSDNWNYVIIGRFLVGAGSSGAILSIFKATSDFFPEHLFPRMLGSAVTIGLLGAIYGSTPVSKLSNEFGWQNIITIFIIVGLVISVLVYIFKSKQVRSVSKADVIGDLKIVFTNKRVIALALFSGFMVGPLEGFADVWAVPFLETVYGYSRDLATSLPTLIFIGMCIGSPLLPTIAEKYKISYQVVILCGIIMTLIFSILPWTRPDWIITTILFIVVGICCAYQILVIYMNSKNVSPAHQSLVTALTNMIIMFFGSLFHISIGKIMHLCWEEQMIDNVVIYPASSYTISLSVIPIGLIIGVIGVYFLKPRKNLI